MSIESDEKQEIVRATHRNPLQILAQGDQIIQLLQDGPPIFLREPLVEMGANLDNA